MVVDQIKVFPLKLNKHLKEGYLKDLVSYWKIQHSGFKNKKEENKDHCIEVITNYLKSSSLNHTCLKGVVVEKNQTAFLVPAGPLLLTEQNNSPEGILLENNCELGIISKSREEDFEFDLFCNFLTSKDDLNDIDRKVLEKEVKEWNKQRKVLLESVDLTPQIENIVLT